MVVTDIRDKNPKNVKICQFEPTLKFLLFWGHRGKSKKWLCYMLEKFTRCLRRPCISKILASWKLNSWKAKEKTIVLFNVRVNNSVSVGKTAETLKFLNRFTPAQSGNWFCNIFHFSGVYFCLQKPFCPAGKWHKTSWDIVVLTSNFSLTIS